jgi:hypothetical protein
LIIDMKLDLRLTHRFLDQLWCQAIVVFLFEPTSRQEEYLSKINKALASSLTPLIDTHFITGKKGELILIAPQYRIKAEKLLFVGLGPASNYSARILPGVARKVSSALGRLQLDEFCITIPVFEAQNRQYETFVRSMVCGTVDHYEQEKKGVVDFILRVFVSIDRDVCSNMQSLEQSLRSYLDPHKEYTIVIDESRG